MKIDKNQYKRLKNWRRYYSHRMIKKHLPKNLPINEVPAVFSPRSKIIFCNDLEALKPILRKHILILSNNYGYNIQTFIK